MKSRKVLDFGSYSRLFEQQAGINDPKPGATPADPAKPADPSKPADPAKPEATKEKPAGETSGAVKTISEIISLFFKCYMFVATKAPNYPDVLADLLSVSEEKDPAKRAETMESVIKKVTEKVDPKYADIKEDANKAAASIKSIYNEVASTEDAKKYTEVINKMVTSKILSYQDILKNQPLKENNNPGYKNILGFDSYYYPSLYEKNTFDEERDGLSDKMKSIYSEMVAQQKNPSSDTLKAKASEVIAKFDEYQKLLSDKGAWEKMKRKERKDKLESMNAEIDDIIQKTNELQKTELIKIGVDKKIADNMSTIITSINSMSDKAKAIDDKAIADAKAAEGAKTEEYKVGDLVKYKRENGEEAQSEIVKIEGDKIFFKDKEGKEFSKDKKEITGKVEGAKEEEGKDIKSGTVEKENIKKDGPNSAAIKKFQEDYNNLGIGAKLVTDGAYGRNTEKAIVKVANMIKSLSGKEVKVDGGKILTGELQGLLKKLIENKDKIKGLLG